MCNSSNKYSKYFYGSKPLVLAVKIMLIKIVEALAPFSELENKKFFLFITKGLIPRSAKLLSIGIFPSLK